MLQLRRKGIGLARVLGRGGAGGCSKECSPWAIEVLAFFAMVRITVVKAANAWAPRLVLEHCETLRAITAGRSARSARLLVGSMAGLWRNRNTWPRSCCKPMTSRRHW